MENSDEKREISAFEHENDMMHLGRANHRMLIALICVCVTFILTIIIFVHGYTIREKNWLDTLSRYLPQNAGVNVDGLHEQPD